ncbi:MAG: hypothetical protein H7098_07820 [Oligoflexus sp.]|nr:hypothetical protein [Pseudopedobacter sp.]
MQILSDYIIVITLLRLPNKSNTNYLWEDSDGKTFGNRPKDVDTWIKRKQITAII